MTKKRLWLGMLVITLVFGMAVLGCSEEEETSEYDGTWVKDTTSMIISGRSYTWKQENNVIDRGTFSVSGTTVTMNSSMNTSQPATVFTMSISGNTATISGLSSTYSSFNGIWTRQ
jgi:hypothetical protein